MRSMSSARSTTSYTCSARDDDEASRGEGVAQKLDGVGRAVDDGDGRQFR
jgi:hypothetical protein